MAKISFIGLGNMGTPMARNLLKAGHELTVFDISVTAMDKLVADGARKAQSAAKSISNADYVISMLPAGRHVKQLYLGDDQLLETASQEGTAIFIDSSTIEADVSQDIERVARAKGISFVDAPVSGGVGGAISGTLAFMVGGSKKDFDLVKPVLETMGRNIFHAGESGAGQIAKACNNMLLGILMAGTSETLNMGIRNGLDPGVLSQIMKKSSGGNWVLEAYNPVPGIMNGVPSSNNYQGGFQVNLMHKDLGLAMELSQKSVSPTPLGSQASSLYALHKSKGYGSLDFSSIYELYNESDVDK